MSKSGEQEWPEEIELLFDRERPGVTEAIIWVAEEGLVVIAQIEERADCLKPDNFVMAQQQYCDEQGPVEIKRGKIRRTRRR